MLCMLCLYLILSVSKVNHDYLRDTLESRNLFIIFRRRMGGDLGHVRFWKCKTQDVVSAFISQSKAITTNMQSTATVIHRSPGHVIDRSLYLRLVAKRPLLRAFLHRLVCELHASTELSAFVCSPMPTHDNLVIIYPCDAPQKCKEFIQVVM